MTAFSVEVGKQYAAELALKLVRCPMNEAARKREIGDFARLVVECYRVEKMKDWSPLPAVEGREDAPRMAQ